jgi:Mg-chelatase subunit ChlD
MSSIRLLSFVVLLGCAAGPRAIGAPVRANASAPAAPRAAAAAVAKVAGAEASVTVDLPVAPAPEARVPSVAAAAPSPRRRSAFVFLVDRSTSMAGRTAAVRRALERAVTPLRAELDLVEIVGFAAKADVVLPLGPARTDFGALSKMRHAPGTDLYDAIDLAHGELAEVAAERRHVVLVIDGRAAPNQGLPSAISALAADGVTFTAIGLGNGVDAEALADLAARGRGRFHAAEGVAALEGALAREVALVLARPADQPVSPPSASAPPSAGGSALAPQPVATTRIQ